MKIPIIACRTCDFPGVVRTPIPPLDPRIIVNIVLSYNNNFDEDDGGGSISSSISNNNNGDNDEQLPFMATADILCSIPFIHEH